MRSLLFFLLLLGTASITFSQDIIVKTSAKGLYVEHKVGAKESIYSLGRLYHVHPRHLAGYNKLEITQGLNIGQVINIPLSDTNFNRTSDAGTPVYYQSQLKQTAGSISALSKTSSGNIRKWNNLSDDNIGAGTKIIIGYLQTGEEQPAPAETAKAAPSSAQEAATTQPVTVQEKKEEAKPEPAVVTAVVKEEEKPSAQYAQHVSQVTTDEGDGYFKDSFVQQVKSFPLSKEETVTAGIFKTASGWNDGKYYALIDGVDPGTILRVVNPNNNKVVFVKVLGQMSGIRQNEGYNLRISNAAAATLQITETDKFIVKVNY